MIKYLKDVRCIDFHRLLLLRAKELEISDEECHILSLIMALSDVGIKSITPQVLLEYSSCSNKQLDDILSSLMKKKWIYNRLGSIKFDKLEEMLLKEHIEEDSGTPEMDLLTMFEEEFGRSLSPMELNTIREWKESYGYQEDMIVMALKEAVKGQVLSFRYMEGILKNWAKNGVKRRYIETPSEEQDVEVSNYEWWK